jgi:hypothetical protein
MSTGSATDVTMLWTAGCEKTARGESTSTNTGVGVGEL